MSVRRLHSALDRSAGFWLPSDVVVDCSSAGAVPRRPIKESILWFRGVRKLVWQDRRGSVTRAIALPPLDEIVSGLASNAVTIASGLRSVRRLEAASREPRSPNVPPRLTKALYLRTDHWFGLTGGGSVAHTSGVINGLEANGIGLSIVSTDSLQGIDINHKMELVRPEYGHRAIINGAVELAYNNTLLAIEANLMRSAPAFVYQRSSFMNYVGAHLRLQHGLPFVCEFNGPLRWVGKNWDSGFDLLGPLAERIETLTLKAADMVVVVSEVVRDIAIDRGVPAERILVNPNGVDSNIYRPDIDSSQLRTSMNLDGKIVLGFIGTFGEWHGADKLAAAYVSLRNMRPDLVPRLHLMMIGDGPTRARSAAIIEAAGAGASATFTGAVAQTDGPMYLSVADILVSPHVPNPDGSRFFGSPTKLFEYMAMGRPIVASALEQIGQILVDRRTALLVAPGDVEALADGIASLIDNPELARSLAVAARAAAVEKHSWNGHARNIIDGLSARLGLRGDRHE